MKTKTKFRILLGVALFFVAVFLLTGFLGIWFGDRRFGELSLFSFLPAAGFTLCTGLYYSYNRYELDRN